MEEEEIALEHVQSDKAQAYALNQSEYFKRIVKKHTDHYTNVLRSRSSDEDLKAANLGYRAIEALMTDLLAPLTPEKPKPERDIKKDSK